MVALLAALVGCSVHEPISIEPGPVPEAFLEEKKESVVKQIGGRWWEQFEDKVLNNLMDEVLIPSVNHFLISAVRRAVINNLQL
jgi:outer membrane protein TolC